MKLKKGKFFYIVAAILILIFIAFIILFNKNKSNQLFWDANISEILSIFVNVCIGILGLYIAKNITEKNSDDRKFKDCFLKIIDEVNGIVSNLLIIHENKIEQKKILVNIRSFNNLFELIKSYSNKLNIDKKIDEIEQIFNGYQEMVGLCFNNIIINEETENCLKKKIDLIQTKLYEIKLSIY